MLSDSNFTTVDFGFVDGIGSAACFRDISSISISSSNEFFIIDHGILRHVVSGNVTSHLFHIFLSSVVPNSAGTYLYSTCNDSVIVKISTTTWELVIIGGTLGTVGYVDGSLSDSLFDNPRGIACDSYDNLYVAVAYYIRFISTSNNIVVTLAGLATCV